ncbi:MAG: DUF4870 domain-containing protein [Proteobacteria bacterium]|nr:DUF4870 domain-containing protein [Pseudomonadota bacterium]
MQADTGTGVELQPSREERQWAMFCHLSAMLMYCTAIGGFVAPLVIWLLKRDEMPFVADQGRETLNFQITTMLAIMACLALWLLILPLLVAGLVVAYHFVMTIIATVRSSEGVYYRYPICWRVIR